MKYVKIHLISIFFLSALISHAQNAIVSLHSFNDSTSQKLKKHLSNKTVIALGEATHGIKEFFDVKAEFIKFLILELDYKVIVFESFFTDSEDINNYIQNGAGSPYKSMLGMGYYFYLSGEFYQLIEWLKEYNTKVNTEEKVRIYGVDMTSPQMTAKKVKNILLENNLLTNSLSNGLDLMINQPGKRVYTKKEVSIIEDLMSEINQAFKNLDQQYVLQQHYNRILQQSLEYRITKKSALKPNMRDEFMAENTMFVKDTLEPNKKIIIWAHNHHIAKHGGADNRVPMGKYLADALGASFYSIGFGFNSGEFLAFNNSTNKRENISVNDADEKSSDYYFSKNMNSVFYINFSSITTGDSGYKWVHETTISRHIGSGYFPNSSSRNYRRHILAESYDGLVFVRQTHAIKLLGY